MVLRSDLEQPTLWASVFTLQEGRFLGTSSSAGGGLCYISLWEAAAPGDSCSHLGPLGPRTSRLPAAALAGPLLLSLALEWAPHSLTLPRPLSQRRQGSLQAQGLCILFFPPLGMIFPLSFARLAPCLPGFRANIASARPLLSPSHPPWSNQSSACSFHITLLYFLPNIYHSLTYSFYLHSCTCLLFISTRVGALPVSLTSVSCMLRTEPHAQDRCDEPTHVLFPVRHAEQQRKFMEAKSNL